MPMNREKFERMLDEIAAEYPGAEKQVDALRGAMDEEGAAPADELEADLETAPVAEGDEEDLEAPLPVPPKKKPAVEEDDEDEEVLF